MGSEESGLGEDDMMEGDLEYLARCVVCGKEFTTDPDEICGRCKDEILEEELDSE